jgi:hypothetical protein
MRPFPSAVAIPAINRKMERTVTVAIVSGILGWLEQS